jgi:putative sterol carrier protein
LTENKEKQAEDLIKTIVEKINANSEKLKGWSGSFQIVFKDANGRYLIKVSSNGKVERVEKNAKSEESVATITTTTEILQSILDGQTSPILAMMKGQIQVEGSIGNLMKLGAAFM